MIEIMVAIVIIVIDGLDLEDLAGTFNVVFSIRFVTINFISRNRVMNTYLKKSSQLIEP